MTSGCVQKINVYGSRGDIRYFLKGLKYHWRYWISHAVLLTYFTQNCFMISCNICWGVGEKNWSLMFSLLKKEKENPTQDRNVSALVISGERRVDPNLEWLEVKILVIVCIRCPMLLSACTPKQCHLVFYDLAICQFFPCSLKFNKFRNGSETTFRVLPEH